MPVQLLDVLLTLVDEQELTGDFDFRVCRIDDDRSFIFVHFDR